MTILSSPLRIGWLDMAKGMTIVLVVMMHTALGVSTEMPGPNALRWLVDFALPFRIPAFFFLAGVLAPRAMEKNWPRFLDAKLLHFAYFYVLWLTLQFALKAPHMVQSNGLEGVIASYLTAFVQPFGTLWFIYLLPLFFIVARLIRSLPVLPVVIVLAALEIFHVATGAIVIDEFCARFVYFYAGCAFSAQAFACADTVKSKPFSGCCLIVLWLLGNWFCVSAGLSGLPFVSLFLGALGTLGLVSLSVFLALATQLSFLQTLGRHSLVIYLSFFLPMAFLRETLISSGLLHNAGLVSVLVLAGAVVFPLGLHRLVQKTGIGLFLFERPKWARFSSNSRTDPI